MTVLALIERGQDGLTKGSLECLGTARSFGEPVAALVVGELSEPERLALAAHGVDDVHVATHDLLDGYNAEARGDVLVGAIRHVGPSMVVAPGSETGNEVMAHAAAVLDVAMVANVVAIEAGSPFTVRRVRWGGSLIEVAEVAEAAEVADVAKVGSGGPLLFTVAPHAEPEPAPSPAAATVHIFAAELDPAVARSAAVERVQRAAGLTLATAPVVVSGGRGVGSAAGFAPLEELAELLGGVVGCSRAVTNNGWRNHTDQVGQTGTRIAPEIYIACGISGAIQHWVGAMGSKRILAINTDAQANMVAKADYAVIGDLHQVVPAITAEIRRRRGA